MDLWTLLRGMIIGFSIAAPVGPIGALCIRRTLNDGRAAGFVSGLGAATADALYGLLAALGLSAVTAMLLNLSVWLRLLGGFYLCYLGWSILRAEPGQRLAASNAGSGLAGAYFSTLALTLTNPATMLSFAAVFAGLGAAQGLTGLPAAVLLVLGVFLGSALWWLLLSGGVGLFRERMDARKLRWVNWISGAVILVFGGIALLSLLASWPEPLALNSRILGP